jgi:hypothetical protein
MQPYPSAGDKDYLTPKHHYVYILHILLVLTAGNKGYLVHKHRYKNHDNNCNNNTNE